MTDQPDIRYAIDQPDDNNAPRNIAKHGPWSATFYNRTRHALTLAPELTAHMISMRRATGTAGERVQTTKVPPAPLNVAAVDDADGIYKSLLYWARLFAKQIGTTAPAALARSRRVDNDIEGFPASIRPAQAHTEVRNITAWYNIWLDSIMYLNPHDVQSFHDDIRDVFRLQARWPIEERPRYSNLPCPDNSHDTDQPGRIALYPPQQYGDEQIIKCDNCGRYFDVDDYERLIVLFAQQAEEQKRTRMRDAARRQQQKRTVDHLTRRYG